jgi:predicted patatin/cPLA2 family phospholipase
MEHISDAYTVNQIKSLELKIAELTTELEYNKSWLYLDNLANTQEVKYVDFLAVAYGVKTKMAFDTDAFRNNSKSGFFSCVNIVKRAIEMYKSSTNTTTNPCWANQAKKAAIIVDKYNNK